MKITTTDFISGYKITETIGLVKGNTIRAKHIGKDIMAGLKQLVGGELKGYTEMIQEARDQALQRMVDEAKQKGADAVINMRFITAELMQSAAEVLAYGTAVKIKKG